MVSKVIIVTGASRGIGLAISRYLLQPPHSCNLVVLSRTRDALEQLKSSAPSPDRVQIVSGDAADPSLPPRAVDLALSTWGRIDGLILNHGQVEPVARVADADLNAWRSAFDINVFSAVEMVKSALPALREAGKNGQSKGRIILTSSGAAVSGYSAWGSYGMAKAALNHLPLTLAKEEPDITTVAIRPGVVDTEMQATLASQHWGKMDEADVEKFKTAKREGKMLKPEQPGHVMAKLVLDAPEELTGMFLSWNDEKLAIYQEP